MDWATQCAAVIPCLNEERTIGILVSSIRAILPVVIVIDDGSTDQTGERAAQAGAEVIRNHTPQGKGAALQAGWHRAKTKVFAGPCLMDGDGQHAPNDIPAFFRCVERTNATLVIGNRMSNPGGMPWVRQRVNRWMSHRLSVALGQSLPDSQSGFRLMSLEAWSRLVIESAHFEIESEILAAFIGAGCKVEFVPIEVIYKEERSKIHIIDDTVRWFRWWHGRRKGSQTATAPRQRERFRDAEA